jgi:hypothetical protein
MTADKFIERCKTELEYTDEDIKKSCYDPYTNSCDGRCQGCSSCILAREFHTNQKEPSACKCRDLIFKSRKSYYEFNKKMKEVRNTPAYQEFLKDMERKYL